jgi:hypothetical protein
MRKVKANAPAFGTRERVALYGRHEGQTGRSGARTDKKKRIRAEANSKKKQQAAEAELEDHFKKIAAHADAAYARVLGRSGRANAIKISPGDGSTLNRRALEELEAQGWQVWPGRTAPAVLGKSLEAFRENPTSRLDRALGEQGRTRAVVVVGNGITRETVDGFRESGYDVSPAPKELREASLKANPQKIGQGRTGADTTRGRIGKSQAMRNAPQTSSTKGLARVWKMWTGSQPTKEIRLRLDELGKTVLPASMVLLGTVCALIGTDGAVKQWGNKSALYLVTDATARRTWLLSEKPEAFDFNVAVISYIATKEKYGDTAPTEYVHEFTRPARARMDGQTGTLEGSFQLTPKGIEG